VLLALLTPWRASAISDGTSRAVTLFDVLVGLVLGVSGIVGFARGATREITTVIAFVLAAVAAIFGLRFTGPLARHFIATPWMATTAAILILFLVVYVILRLIAGRLSTGVRRTALSGFDRGLGFVIGLVRGVVVVGVVALLINAATPPERMPAWYTRAKVYPLANAAGGTLRAFAPKGLQVAHDVAADAEQAVTAPTSAQDGPPAPRRGSGYSESQRKALDDLVEKSR
jgi:membrane protein required for colicin V production